jgi:hypothetical protein
MPVQVSENGAGFYETPLSLSNSTYRIYKIDILNKTTSTFYSYNDNNTSCVYKYSNTKNFSGSSVNCRQAGSLYHNMDGTIPASEYDPSMLTVCGTMTCGMGYPSSCSGTIMVYNKECTTSRANQNKALHTVAPNGSFVIIYNNNTSYYKISSENLTSISSGSNYKISPNNTDFIFTYSDHTYKNSTSAENLLIQNRKSSNICFSSNGKYFIFVDPTSGYVYKQYMSNADAL